MLILGPNELDLAQTIAAIVAQHDNPSDECLTDVYDPNRHKYKGELPKHLRHLYHFILKLKNYANKVTGEVESQGAHAYTGLVEAVFKMSPNTYLKLSPEDKDVNLLICKGWLVVIDRSNLS